MKVILVDKTEIEITRYRETNNAAKYEDGQSGRMAWLTMDGDMDEGVINKAFTNDNIKTVTLERSNGKQKTLTFSQISDITLNVTDMSDEYVVTLK